MVVVMLYMSYISSEDFLIFVGRSSCLILVGRLFVVGYGGL